MKQFLCKSVRVASALNIRRDEFYHEDPLMADVVRRQIYDWMRSLMTGDMSCAVDWHRNLDGSYILEYEVLDGVDVVSAVEIDMHFIEDEMVLLYENGTFDLTVWGSLRCDFDTVEELDD